MTFIDPVDLRNPTDPSSPTPASLAQRYAEVRYSKGISEGLVEILEIAQEGVIVGISFSDFIKAVRAIDCSLTTEDGEFSGNPLPHSPPLKPICH